MTKPTARKMAQFLAISGRKAAAANDQGEAPRARGTLKLAEVVATVEINSVEIKDGADGKPHYTFKGSDVILADGGRLVRTVMAFESYDMVRGVVLAGQDLRVTLTQGGSTMKIVGVEVDGVMTMVDRADLAKAA